MSRVAKEVLKKMADFLDNLPGDVRNKCSLCNETLTHIVKQAEAQTGAPVATITREIAERHNEGAAPGDVVSGEKLRLRVRQKEDDRNLSGHNDHLKTKQPPQETPNYTDEEYEYGDEADGADEELSDRNQSEYQEVLDTVSPIFIDGAKIIKAANTHVGRNSGENEWYTPSVFIDSAREVMGSIDLDPASSEIANKTVKATKFFSIEDNGLYQEWGGNIWMNPPYANPLIKQFSDKLCQSISNISQVIVLVNNATETVWFQQMAMIASTICFTNKRIKFLDPEGNPGAPLQGQAILYFGDNGDIFAEKFSSHGFIVSCLNNN